MAQPLAEVLVLLRLYGITEWVGEPAAQSGDNPILEESQRVNISLFAANVSCGQEHTIRASITICHVSVMGTNPLASKRMVRFAYSDLKLCLLLCYGCNGTHQEGSPYPNLIMGTLYTLD